ncbi:hypothetical protein C6B38_00425 [Spiroplasma sp. ChiS]|nr:hypothetical protein C6B38_00425 [Spiroplasma sp. ChiS]
MIYIILVVVDVLFIGKIIFDLLFFIWELIENKKQNKNNKIRKITQNKIINILFFRKRCSND